MKIHEHYGIKSKPGDVGIEIEVEWPADQVPLKEHIGIWRFDNDSSLQNGLEYITRQPVNVDNKLVKRIQVLTDRLKASNVNPSSPRGSVHIHANVCELTATQVWTVATTYWIIEQVMMSFFNKTRQGNLFCLRLSDAEGIIKKAELDIKGKKTPFKSLLEDNVKYAGLNLATVAKYGSLEFRGMHSSVNHQEIYEWAHCVHTLVTTASTMFKSPQEVVDYVLDNNAYGLIDACTSGSIRSHCLAQQGVKSLVRNNMSRVFDLVYAVPDWAAWEKSLPGAFVPGSTLTIGNINDAFAILHHNY